ncbi:MAG: Gfo/Idh/MocA family oxidoreductase [Bryobacteraceae bacterium]
MNNRREIIQSGLLILSAKTAFGSQANSTVELGLIGCGSRGNWVTDLFHEHTLARVTALADAFAAPIEAAKAKYKVDGSRAFVGLDAFEKLAASKLDGIVIESPPFYHPEQAMAGVTHNKHVYLAKPVATDVVGCKAILAAGAKAKAAGRSFLVDFQTRAQPVFQEAAARVHRGEIGTPVLGHVYYHANRTPYHETAGMKASDAALRNWLHNKRFSGDIIVEQNIHVIDVANWYLQGNPLSAFGSCGQNARKLGDVSDHYIVTYWYPKEVKVDFSSAQFTQFYRDLCIRVYGSEGDIDSHYNGSVRIGGKVKWTGSEKDNTFKDGAVANMKAFVESIRSGKAVNNSEEAVRSNLTAILGRMAASRRAVVTWDEMMQTTEPYTGVNGV